MSNKARKHKTHKNTTIKNPPLPLVDQNVCMCDLDRPGQLTMDELLTKVSNVAPAIVGELHNFLSNIPPAASDAALYIAWLSIRRDDYQTAWDKWVASLKEGRRLT